jgi:hypothetical protein
MQPSTRPRPQPSGILAGNANVEVNIVWSACLFAALRIFIFSAAFPFFNNVDEQYHFDLVLRYARGEGRPALSKLSGETAEYIALYHSPEYYTTPNDYADKKIVRPLWMLPRDEAAARCKGFTSVWAERINREGTNPPLYYWIAARWWRTGEFLGIGGGYLLYWVRFLNVILGAVLVWIGYLAARLVFPESRFARVAVAVLLAVFPQDTFYSIQSDVLSPVLFGLAFVGLIILWSNETFEAGWAVLTGLSVSATVLVKATNLPLLAVSVLAIAFRIVRVCRSGKFQSSVSAFAMLILCILLPTGFWMMWNISRLHDLTGVGPKASLMGWTAKSFSEFWPHPLFTLRGWKEFLGELLASFWRGEFTWFRQRLASPLADDFYVLSSLALIAVNTPALFRRNSAVSPAQRAILWMALASFAAVVAFQAVCSMAFDFGPCEYPSRAHPLLTSGRLMTGALIPFLLLYARGLEKLFCWRGHTWIPWVALSVVVFVVMVSEIVVNRPAFSSLYNFFHLPPGPEAVASVPAK